jgi:FkbM family methyltransferase
MARDFLLWRHLRVVRARAMRHVHRMAGRLVRSAFPRVVPRPVRSAYGVRMWPDWDDRTFAYCRYGTYGRYLADLLAGIDRPFCFLDIGANQGLFSLIAANNPQCRQIVALEPVPATYRKLAANLALAGIGERVVAIAAALSYRAGPGSIIVNPVHSGQASLEPHMQERAACHPVAIELITMAELDPCLPRHLPIFVKVDVEGHEPVIIEALLASPHAPRVIGLFYEHDNRWTDNATIARALYRAGFTRLTRYGRGRHFDVLAGPSPVPLERIPAFEQGIAEVSRQRA